MRCTWLTACWVPNTSEILDHPPTTWLQSIRKSSRSQPRKLARRCDQPIHRAVYSKPLSFTVVCYTAEVNRYDGILFQTMGGKTNKRLLPFYLRAQTTCFLFPNRDVKSQKAYTVKNKWCAHVERTLENSKNTIFQNGRRTAELFSCNRQ